MLSSPQVEIDQADSSVQSQGIKSAQRESVEGEKKLLMPSRRDKLTRRSEIIDFT
jgi:hypothetical protein